MKIPWYPNMLCLQKVNEKLSTKIAVVFILWSKQKCAILRQKLRILGEIHL